MSEPTATTPIPQPFLHELVSCVQAPTVALSSRDGQIRSGGGQGVFRHDCRIISELVIDIDGAQPVPVGHSQPDTATAQFVGVVRHLGDPIADPTVRLERLRHLTGDRLSERLTLINASRQHVSATVRMYAAVDFAAMDAVKHGVPSAPAPPCRVRARGASWVSTSTDGAHTTTLRVSGDPELVEDGGRLRVTWQVVLAPGQRWVATATVAATAPRPDPDNTFVPAPGGPGWLPVAVAGPPELVGLVEQAVSDLSALMLADPRAPGDRFAAAGSPWFLTLFGRDALWTARLTLPFGTDLAAGTLRTLARRQGRRHDPETGEAPGKILHEVRSGALAPSSLPPVYYGTIDATALWVCLLHEAWCWGLPNDQVAALLDALEGALGWLMRDADPDRDGFLEYRDLTGHGLANQGWKDSVDSIQFPDGSIAGPPIALCEAQAYAYQAATSGARLLETFGRPGAGEVRQWAQRLRERFRASFWVEDARGRFPAIALDGRKQPVPTAASNLGHLLGTGLLDEDEAAAVAARLSQPDLDCGYGLRTMSADVAGFNPLGYHTGSVWPHDTVIAIRGLVQSGHGQAAASLAKGLLRAAGAFDRQLPELFAGTDARTGEAVLAYPAACRPQAWSAAAVLGLLPAVLGLVVDVPGRSLAVNPPAAFGAWFPLRVSGLRLAGQPLTVAVDADGQVHVDTTGPVTVRPAGYAVV